MILCGSKSDMHIVEGTTQILDENQIPYVVEVASAHREPDKVQKIFQIRYIQTWPGMGKYLRTPAA